ncbi:MAG: hypothetical protein ABR976_22260 [Terracidiphilus sp.]
MASDQQPSQLVELAQAKFNRLSDAEIKLLRAAEQGEIACCGPEEKLDDPSNDPVASANWGPERRISAKLIRWLCVNRDARDLVDARGIRVQGARIEGRFEIPFVVVPFALGFARCSFWDYLDFRSIEISSMDLTGSWLGFLNLDHATVKGSIILSGVRCAGLQLCGARIGGNLECEKASFPNPVQAGADWSGVAIDATDAKVDGAVLFRYGFAAEGVVRLFSATIGESLDCAGSTFRNPAQKDPRAEGVALDASYAKVTGNILLSGGLVAEGAVRVYGTQAGGSLDCSSSTFRNPAQKDVVGGGTAIEATNLNVTGAVYLRKGVVAEGAVWMVGAQIGGDLDCGTASLKNPLSQDVAESGMALNLEGTKVTGNMLLSGGFVAEGAVRLYGTQAGGTLDCSGSTFRNPAQKDAVGAGTAIEATNLNVSGAVYLRNGFVAEGSVWMVGAQIGGNLDCGAASLKNPLLPNVAETGIALNTEGAKVGGAVHLCNGFVAEGAVWMLGSRVDWSLDCDGGQFNNLPLAEVAASAPALNMEGITVGGGAYFRAGFLAQGLVRMFAAKFGGNVECDGGQFHNPAKAGIAGSGIALDLEGVKIDGAVYLRNKFNAEGHVRMYGSQIAGNLELEGATFESLNLEEASARAILDDKESWPKAGQLLLDGFKYDRIAMGPISAKERLGWLARQELFTRHPYRQLADVLKESGDNRGWRLVSARMERRTWAAKPRPWVSRPTSWVLRNTIAYGYFPGRALWWLLALVFAGSALYHLGYKAGSMVPIDKDAYASLVDHQQLPGNYPRFHAIPYSLENSFPLLKLGVEDSWTTGRGVPAAAQTGASETVSRIASPRFIQIFRWIQICLGWILGTLFVGGVTGVIRND